MDLETLLRAMLEIVEGWGGVPWAWVFDNMKTVTLGRDAEGQPRWNPAFWRFATEVGFHPELCDPGAAQQKGSVENLVKWVKTNFLPGRSFTDDEDLAQRSLAWEHDKAGQLSQAHGRRPSELLAQERAAFGPLTAAAANYGLYRVATVNRESLVRVDGISTPSPSATAGRRSTSGCCVTSSASAATACRWPSTRGWRAPASGNATPTTTRQPSPIVRGPAWSWTVSASARSAPRSRPT